MRKNFLSIKRLVALVLIMVTMLSIIPAASASAEVHDTPVSFTSAAESSTYTGNALYLALEDITVWKESSFDVNKYDYEGTIFKNETFTVLSDRVYRTSSSGNPPKISVYVKVQYSASTASGSKTGYIALGDNFQNLSPAYLGRVAVSSSVWYGPNTSRYLTIGSVSKDEYVVILDKEYDWLYIEYDSAAGRKRGYIPSSNVYYKVSLSQLDTKWLIRVPYVTDYYNVYSGPTDKYARVGSINTEYVNLFGTGSTNGRSWWRIGYITPSGEKYGYIFPTKNYSD